MQPDRYVFPRYGQCSMLFRQNYLKRGGWGALDDGEGNLVARRSAILKSIFADCRNCWKKFCLTGGWSRATACSYRLSPPTSSDWLAPLSNELSSAFSKYRCAIFPSVPTVLLFRSARVLPPSDFSPNSNAFHFQRKSISPCLLCAQMKPETTCAAQEQEFLSWLCGSAIYWTRNGTTETSLCDENFIIQSRLHDVATSLTDRRTVELCSKGPSRKGNQSITY